MTARSPGNRSHGIISRGPHQTDAGCNAKTAAPKLRRQGPNNFISPRQPKSYDA